MIYLGIIIGFVTGVALCLLVNHLRPGKFDQLTEDASRKVKSKL
jgi:hypothetical protein